MLYYFIYTDENERSSHGIHEIRTEIGPGTIV